jgi:hypothetical protein
MVGNHDKNFIFSLLSRREENEPGFVLISTIIENDRPGIFLTAEGILQDPAASLKHLS